MRRAAALSLLFIVCTFTTCREDTTPGDLWPRPVEPRLSRASQWQPYTKPPALRDERCPRRIDSQESALTILVYQKKCIDAAIAWLNDNEAMSDLAAAYLLRAERQNRPEDLLKAFDAADRAVQRNPRSPAALFNRALALQHLYLDPDAIAAWNAYLAVDNDTGWAKEARDRRAALQARIAMPAQWKPAEIRVALHRRAGDTVARLIGPFPSAASHFYEVELLPQWAIDPSTERLAELKMFAEVLSRRLGGDRYPLDVLPRSNDPALRAGILLLRDAHASREANRWREVEEHAGQASRLLRQAGSPLYLSADLRLAGTPNAPPLTDALAERTRTSHYDQLHAKVQVQRAYDFYLASQYLDALAAYDRALAIYDADNDGEGRVGVRSRSAGIYRVMGRHERAWSECLKAHEDMPVVVSLNAAHNVAGETAKTALELNHPEVALLYQDAFIGAQQTDLANTPPEDTKRIEKLQTHLAIARNTRAVIRVRLGDMKGASEDLDKAIDLSAGKDRTYRDLLDARIRESEGQRLLERQPALAVRKFTDALTLVPASEQSTFRAHLLSQRAHALELSGQSGAKDLADAIAILRGEEQRLLEARKPGDPTSEPLWNAYFARFRETYSELIRHYFENEATDLAFQYAERERAAEPLNLILKRDDVPRAFRAIAGRELVDIDDVRRRIPPGTFLIQYRVLDDRTYIWVLSRDRFDYLQRNIRRETIERWTNDIQTAAHWGETERIMDRLDEPYAELIAPALEGIRNPTRLVFIPDGPIHGLPLAALIDPKTHRHLIETAPIEIAGSTLLYLYSLFRDADLASAPLLALLVGNPAFDKTLGHTSDDLPAAENEAREIRELYVRAEILTGPDATIPAFLDRARRFSIVHVAAHAVVNPREPQRSLILLAPSAGDRGELEAQKLVETLKLHSTRLVVLSACSSAGGLPVGPEGVAPLVRPLIAAGVPAVAGSLWDVKDATTKELMVSFHQRYVQGEDAATAMQSAQLQLLKASDPRLRSVLTWGPFQVIGHASSPNQGPRNGGTDIGTVHSSNLLQRADGVHPR